MKKQKKITHQDVRDAILRFEGQGGIILKLPDHQAVHRPMIGKDKYNNFESLSSFLPW